MIRPEVVRELEAAWRRYGKLNIPGKGDGDGVMARTRMVRKMIENEVSVLMGFFACFKYCLMKSRKSESTSYNFHLSFEEA